MNATQRLRIPTRFKLLGHTIEVVERHDLLQERDWSGAADYQKCKIELLPSTVTYTQAQSKIEQCFCHELSHFLLYFAGGAVNHDLKSGGYIHKNEELVDMLGHLLHQALTTMEYEDGVALEGGTGV